jgi:nicotinate-nucleotide adenylyltransferase
MQSGVIAIFGGTFDPIHHGHLLVARDAMEALDLPSITFMPAPSAPLRGTGPVASFAHRAEMIRLAIAKEPRFSLSLAEAERPGPSYTIDTVLGLRADNPGSRIVWIIGADQLARLPSWHRAEELASLATFAVAARPGFPRRTSLPFQADIRFFGTRENGVSSTEIRDRLAKCLTIRWLVPEEVLIYVQKNALYRD